MTAKAVAPAIEKGKGKRPFTSLRQGRPHPGGPDRQGNPMTCYNRGQPSHRLEYVISPRGELEDMIDMETEASGKAMINIKRAISSPKRDNNIPNSVSNHSTINNVSSRYNHNSRVFRH